jgi:hypothetical protein
VLVGPYFLKLRRVVRSQESVGERDGVVVVQFGVVLGQVVGAGPYPGAIRYHELVVHEPRLRGRVADDLLLLQIHELGMDDFLVLTGLGAGRSGQAYLHPPLMGIQYPAKEHGQINLVHADVEGSGGRGDELARSIPDVGRWVPGTG